MTKVKTFCPDITCKSYEKFVEAIEVTYYSDYVNFLLPCGHIRQMSLKECDCPARGQLV